MAYGAGPMLTLVSLLCVSAAAEPLPKLIILELTPAGNVEASTASAFTETITAEVGARGHFQALSSKDVRTLLGVERQRQLVGCGDSNCFVELAGALGSRYVMTGSLAQLGESFQLNLQVLDTQTSQPLGRASQVAPSLPELRALIPFAVADATHTEPPRMPSKVVPVTMIAVGGAAIVAGAIVGGLALSGQATLQAQLGRSANEGQPLDAPLSAYQQQATTIGTEKTVALAAMISGAAIALVGVVLFPRGPAPGVAVVPSDRGVALVGVFP